MAYYPPGGGGYYPPPPPHHGHHPPPPHHHPPHGGCPPTGYPPGGYPPAARRAFLIISDLNGKCMDIRGGASHPGTDVIMWTPKRGIRGLGQNSNNQLWYLDEMGCIRSMLNDFAPQTNGQGDRVRMQPYNGSPRQQWMFQGNKLANRCNPGECLDIEGGKKHEGAQVISWNYKSSPNQHWRVEYV